MYLESGIGSVHSPARSQMPKDDTSMCALVVNEVRTEPLTVLVGVPRAALCDVGHPDGQLRLGTSVVPKCVY
jgi:hypothetical protein